MRKKRVIKKRHFLRVESKFYSDLVSKFINKIMIDGKRCLSLGIVYKIADLFLSDSSFSSLAFSDIIEKVVDNLKVDFELKSFKRGSSTQRIPVPVRKNRNIHLAFCWIIDSAREKKKSKHFGIEEALFNEMKLAYNLSGKAFDKKKKLENEVSENMAFSSSIKKKR